MDIHKNQYVLAGKHGFFNRFCDSGFKNKWCGLWMDKKYLDYFAYKINDFWLAPENCRNFFLPIHKGVHGFRNNGLEVREELFFSKGIWSILKIRNHSNEKINLKISVEVGINIREKLENWHERGYKIKGDGAVFKISNEKGLLNIIFPNKPNLVNKYYKNHLKNQRCLVLVFEFEKVIKKKEIIEIPFFYSKDIIEDVNNWLEEKREIKREIKRCIENFKIKTPDEKINKLLKWCAVNSYKLKRKIRNKKVLVAGLPWFNEFWTRDFGLCSEALLCLGDFSTVLNSLELIAKEQMIAKPYNVPTNVSNNVSHNSIDSSFHYIISLKNYLDYTGNKKILSHFKESLNKTIKFCQEMEENNLIKTKNLETWMDTLDRSGYPIEVQALFAKMLEAIGFFKKAKEVVKKIRNKFWIPRKKFFADQILINGELDKTKTANCLIPLLFGYADNAKAKHCIEKFKKEFLSKHGIRSRSIKSPDYNESGYHTGMVWGLLTNLFIMTLIKYDEKFLDLIKMISNQMEDYYMYSIPECYSNKPEGCGVQAWSILPLITIFDCYILGIRPKLMKNLVLIEPKIPKEWDFIERKNKKIKNVNMDYIYNKKEIKINFNKKPNFKIRVKLKGKVFEFIPKLNNVILLK